MAMAYKGQLVELPLFGTYRVYEPHVYNLGNHFVIQSRMLLTSSSWLACTEYALIPYSPALVLFKNTRFNIHNATKFTTPGAQLTYFNDGGIRRIFLGLTFWPKGIFFGFMKDAGIFLGRENNTGIFWGIVFFISSNQQ